MPAKKRARKTPPAPKKCAPRQTWEEIQAVGTRPDKPCELYAVQGRGVYNIRTDQIVSLKARRQWMPHEEGELHRSAAGRVPLLVNAGTPTDAHPNAGARFKGHDFLPWDSETSEVEWRSASGEWVARVIQRNWCSPADVLARYAGGEALSESGAGLFVALLMNNGEVELAIPPGVEGFGTGAEWSTQRKTFATNLNSMFLVCPATSIRPVMDDPKQACPVDAHTGDVVPTNNPNNPVMLGCLASILSDKSEGAPGAIHKASIGGYHDRCRLHLLSPMHVSKIVDLVAHFHLHEEFPFLADEDLIDNADVLLEPFRQRAIAGLGAPPQVDVTTDEWQRKRAEMNCGMPWVQHCSAEHPNGQRDEEDAPVLVPLARFGAELRNGSSWLHLEELLGDARYEEVRNLLAQVEGRGSPRPHARGAKGEGSVLKLRSELEAAHEKVDALTRRNAQLMKALGSIQKAVHEVDPPGAKRFGAYCDASSA